MNRVWQEINDRWEQAMAWLQLQDVDWRSVSIALSIFALVYALIAYTTYWRKRPLPEKGKVGEMTKKQRRRITDALVADEILDGLERLVLTGRELNGEHYQLTPQEEQKYIKRIGKAASLRDLTTRYRPKPPPHPEDLKSAIRARRATYRNEDGEITVIRFMDPVLPPPHIRRRIKGSRLGAIIYKDFKPTPPELSPARKIGEGK